MAENSIESEMNRANSAVFSFAGWLLAMDFCIDLGEALGVEVYDHILKPQPVLPGRIYNTSLKLLSKFASNYQDILVLKIRGPNC